MLFGGSRYQVGATAPFQHALARIDPVSGRVELAACDFLPHGWALDPKTPTRAFFFEEGPGAAEFDLAQMRQLRSVPPARRLLRPWCGQRRRPLAAVDRIGRSGSR
jgi:hypothetical protein